MKRLCLLIAVLVLCLTACARDESISKFADSAAEYRLVTLNGLPFASKATIAFPEAGRVEGQAPCNRYFATQTVPYPWFSLEGIGSTRMSCSNMASEVTYFAALENMTLVEVLGGTLILSNTLGEQMVFEAL